MHLSIAETASLLGRSQRQVRYLIKTEQLKAVKEGGRWRIKSRDLPLTDVQRQALAERSQVARATFERGLEPAARAAGAEETTRRYSVTDLFAFQAGEEIYRAACSELGIADPVIGRLYAALELVTRGCHCYHPSEKARRFTEAREEIAAAVAELLLRGDDRQEVRRQLAIRLEQEVIPKLAGLVASYEKRGRRSRFDGFGGYRQGRGG